MKAVAKLWDISSAAFNIAEPTFSVFPVVAVKVDGENYIKRISQTLHFLVLFI